MFVKLPKWRTDLKDFFLRNRLLENETFKTKEGKILHIGKDPVQYYEYHYSSEPSTLFNDVYIENSGNSVTLRDAQFYDRLNPSDRLKFNSSTLEADEVNHMLELKRKVEEENLKSSTPIGEYLKQENITISEREDISLSSENIRNLNTELDPSTTINSVTIDSNGAPSFKAKIQSQDFTGTVSNACVCNDEDPSCIRIIGTYTDNNKTQQIFCCKALKSALGIKEETPKTTESDEEIEKFLNEVETGESDNGSDGSDNELDEETLNKILRDFPDLTDED